jgi:hypothetical protein
MTSRRKLFSMLFALPLAGVLPVVEANTVNRYRTKDDWQSDTGKGIYNIIIWSSDSGS